ncbi:DegT/DnrJ/EryC1/StrS family aminotransferase [Candidatus Woesearchaeota archaeon]|nr:DegT/DnrJ/EryC1/StrS family aminotransferase [Candidatus Woesearchaeota archaeon]
MKVPLCKAYIDSKETDLVREVLESGWLAHGPKNEAFERKFADYIGVKKAISLNSCTSALHLAVEGLGITGEVIVPSFTFSASANAVVTAGAKPVFCDALYDTCNMDPESVRKKITDKTQAIMPVHFAGQPCRMDELMEIAEERGIFVIEDTAETIGGMFNGRKTGAFGTGCFSFYPTKNMTTGEGGMLTTDDLELAAKVSALKAHGMSSSTFAREKTEKPWLRASVFAGYNFRMCDILAAVGLAQIEKIDMMNDLRRRHAKFLDKNLSSEHLDLPVEDKNCHHTYQMYTVKAKGIDRTKFLAALRARGVGASVHFDPPVHLQPYYNDCKRFGWKKEELKVTEKLAESIVTLPMYPGLTQEELEHVVKSVEEAVREAR